MYDFIVIDSGIVGLSTALAVKSKYLNAIMLIIEKENDWAIHQTGMTLR